MSRNLTQRYLRETEIALSRAISISDVTRIARSYAAALAAAKNAQAASLTSEDRAWFRRPLTDGAL